MVKDERYKVEGGTKPKGRHFQPSTSNRKAGFKAPVTVLEDTVFDSGKRKHAADFVKNCKEIVKYIAVNYKHGRLKMAMSIKNMEKQTINVP